jgi:hypothetical protein
MAILKKLVAAIKKFLRGKKNRKKKRPSLRKNRPSRGRKIRKKRPTQGHPKKTHRRFRKHPPLRQARKGHRRLKGQRNSPAQRRKTSRSHTKAKLSRRLAHGKLGRKSSLKQPVKPGEIAAKPIPSSLGLLVGEITHYFSKIEVVVIKITKASIKVGERIQIKGKTTDFVQHVTSIQIESVNVPVGHKGQLIGLKVDQAAKEGDLVYKTKE